MCLGDFKAHILSVTAAVTGECTSHPGAFTVILMIAVSGPMLTCVMRESRFCEMFPYEPGHTQLWLNKQIGPKYTLPLHDDECWAVSN